MEANGTACVHGWVVVFKIQNCHGGYHVMTLFSGLTDDEWCGQLVGTMKDLNSSLENLNLSV